MQPLKLTGKITKAEIADDFTIYYCGFPDTYPSVIRGPVKHKHVGTVGLIGFLLSHAVNIQGKGFNRIVSAVA